MLQLLVGEVNREGDDGLRKKGENGIEKLLLP